MWHWRSCIEDGLARTAPIVAAMMWREWRELSEPRRMFAVVSRAFARYAFV
jgi:hypothetical protein